MVRFAARFLIVAILATGLIAPLASAALAALGQADGRLVVICTGDGLRTIRINDAGEPVGISQEKELCALVGAVSTALPPVSTTARPRLLYAVGPELPAATLPGVFSFSPSLARGPPRG